jgi:hypothetical protein
MVRATLGARGKVTGLATLAYHGERAVAALESEGFDVGADRLGDPQPIRCQQRDQDVVTDRAQPSGDQDGAEFVAVEVGYVGLGVDPRSADVHGGECSMTFFFGVTVEADDHAQSPGDRGADPAGVFEVAGEALDVDPVDVEQPAVVLPAPGGELAQIQREGVAGDASVAGQEPEQRGLLQFSQRRLVPLDRGGGCGHGGTSLVRAGVPDHNATGTSDR